MKIVTMSVFLIKLTLCISLLGLFNLFKYLCSCIYNITANLMQVNKLVNLL